MANDGKIQIQSDLVPDNGNPRQPVTDVTYVTGAPQAFGTIAELVAFHPNKMRTGQSVSVVSIDLYNQRVTVDEYRLMVDPETLLDANKNSIVTIDNFLKFWSQSDKVETKADRVFAYSPDGPGGTKPPFPYIDNPAFEVNWHGVALPTDRWTRFRDSDEFVTVSGVKVYTGWTLPISIGQRDINGDYIDDLYLRQDVDTTERTDEVGLVNTKYYLVLEGVVTESSPSGLVDYVDGRTFQYLSANVYSFSDPCRMIETVPAPPRTINGLANNAPAGWFDVPPGGTQQLWNITAPKSVYGDLRDDWRIRKIFENPDLIRFSEFASPNPNDLVGLNDVATTGSPGDVLLNDNGWLAIFQPDFKFIAERQETGGSPTYTQWIIKKISGESGEYVSRVFKLFDLNADFDFVALAKPQTSDPISEGFFDTPQEETATQINYVFEAVFYFDNTLKGSWSNGVPYTGREIFNDVIESDAADSFKYDPNSDTPDDPSPSQITLTAQLYKGIRKISEVTLVQYEWKRVYNNGAAEDLLISSFVNTDPVYLLPTSGVEGEEGFLRDGQRLVVKPDAVTGKAIFQVTQTFVIDGGTNLTFVELIAINDVTDGLDARDLSIKADAQLVIYDSVGAAFAPSEINLNAFYTNLIAPIIKWFQWVGGVWVEIDPGDSSILPAFVITDMTYGSKLTILSDAVFDADEDLEEFRFAATTHNSNPELADSLTTFSDFITITKASAAAVGSPGANASFGILDNEYQNITLDDDTFIPFAGEIGASGRAQGILSVFDGIDQIPYGAGAGKFTISLTSDNPDVTFGSNTVGLTNSVRIYVNTWTPSSSQRKAKCTININYDTGSENIIFTKSFTVGSVLDTPGALVLIVDSDKGFNFLVSDRSNKTLTAKVYDSSKAPALQNASNYYFNWTIAGVSEPSYTRGGSPTFGEIRSISRAQILISADITVWISKVPSPGSSDILRAATIRVNDIADGRLYRLFSSSVSAPAKPISSVGPAGNGTWFPNISNPQWAVDGYENPGTNPVTYTWSNPYRVGGEQGDQGFSGGFYYEMYNNTGAVDSAPAFGAGGNQSTVAQMYAAGWRSSTPGQFPVSPTNGNIWLTKRLYKTQNLYENELLFDASGYPIDAVEYSSLAVWLTPQKINASPGTGDPGAPGDEGWSPVFGVVARSSTAECLQLIDWIGGTGTKPGYIGYFLSAIGFVSDINLARNIKGNTGNPGNNGIPGPPGTGIYIDTGYFDISATTLNPGFPSYYGLGREFDSSKKYLAFITLRAQDSGAAGMFSAWRDVQFGRTPLVFEAAAGKEFGLQVSGDGAALIKPNVENVRVVAFTSSSPFNQIAVTLPASPGNYEIGGYTGLTMRVVVIQLSA